MARRNVQFKCRVAFAAIILFILTIAAAPVEAKDFFAEIEAENERWLAVYKSRDAQGFGSLYTRDAVIIPQGGPPIRGHTAIVQFWFEMFKNEFQDPKLEIIDLYKEGKIAYQTCRWTVSQPKQNGSIRQITGNTLRIFERQRNGRWLIKVQMSNAD